MRYFLASVVAAVLAMGTIRAVAQSAAEPGTIAGRVMSAEKPVDAVSVQAFRAGTTKPAATAVTGPDGAYRLVKLPQGVYRVEFAREGFTPLTRAGIVVFDDKVTELDVELSRGNPEQRRMR
jgi:hypothetical protein